MSPSTQPELVRGILPHPGRPGTSVVFFATLDLALSHLRDHVLTAPESHAWAVVLPRLVDHVDPHDPNGCNDFYRQAEATRGLSAQAVFDLYRQAAVQAASEAFLLSWHRSDAATTAALGSNGVLVLITRSCVVTVYLPGQGNSAAVLESHDARPVGLPRQRQLMRREETLPNREERKQAERATRRSPEEELFYRVFRPAVQFLRGRYHQAFTLDGWRRHDDALLKEVLPTMSQLRLEDWLRYRARVSPGGGS